MNYITKIFCGTRLFDKHGDPDEVVIDFLNVNRRHNGDVEQRECYQLLLKKEKSFGSTSISKSKQTEASNKQKLDVVLYIKNSKYTTDVGISNHYPTKSTNWVADIIESTLFDYYQYLSNNLTNSL